jgi:hypothetical protein
MSSTELASQEQQESIKQAEQEALEHSILVKTAAPRAKITHKGLQDIEDVNEDSAVAKQRERELEMADQERERERLARLRTITIQPQPQGHSNPPSASLPPESPVVPTSASGTGPASWGAPPPVPPAQAQAADFAHTVDPELNLGDFIHMDDEPSESAAASTSASVTPELPVSMSESPAAEQASGQQGQTTPITGISPFAPSKPDMPPRASFDLNALWSAPPPPPPPAAPSNEAGDTDDTRDAMDLSTPTPPVEEVSSRGGEARSAGGPERGAEREGEGGDDLDFAMFLGQEEEEKEKEKDKEKETIEHTSRPDPQVVFEALPHVWNGIVSRPLSSHCLTTDEPFWDCRSACRSTRACHKSSRSSPARSAGEALRPIHTSGGRSFPSTTSGSTAASPSAALHSTCSRRGSTRPRSSSPSFGRPSPARIWRRSRPFLVFS